ncbi:MAG: metallopeptidase family protein [Gordonia sp. (in: high G+C Gram-positive bacteria)]|uniref:metallopeptidase family protein n=1 Tax=Gordonia sp. (in: high G+C Gram-positive bacteria) TaxID=84139 RepID=UPI0039E613F8
MRFRPATGRELLTPARRTRDRRGRGLRSPVLPPILPAHRSRSDLFDKAAVTAFAEIDAAWHDQLTGLDLAVDDIPRILPRDLETVQWPEEVTADGPVPLARLIPAGIDARGRPTRAQLILFRRPIELRSRDDEELPEILREILIQQVATYLGVDEETIESGPQN